MPCPRRRTSRGGKHLPWDTRLLPPHSCILSRQTQHWDLKKGLSKFEMTKQLSHYTVSLIVWYLSRWFSRAPRSDHLLVSFSLICLLRKLLLCFRVLQAERIIGTCHICDCRIICIKIHRGQTEKPGFDLSCVSMAQVSLGGVYRCTANSA